LFLKGTQPLAAVKTAANLIKKLENRRFMNARTKKFFSYYKPYLGLFISVMVCAMIVAGITLILPLCTRYITKHIVAENAPDALRQIVQVGLLMLVLVAIHTASNFYVAYRGHSMGAMMESDLRSELFEHYQKLSFSFYDEQRTGELMSRITNDLFWLSELYHHGPEDLLIYSIKGIGAFVILLQINAPLTLVIFLFLPIMVIYASYFYRRMHSIFKRNWERIGDINAQVEDTLSGIRVVKSFANEAIEAEKFADANQRFLESRKLRYKNEALSYEGLTGFTQLMTITVVIVGGASIVTGASLDLADLIVFLLYIGNLIEPILRLSEIIQQYQQGFTGFERFMEILEIGPEIQDSPDAKDIKKVHGNIELRNVSFRYRDHHAHVLKNISLMVKAGDTVALVGSSGVGKSTLCSLIPRFYELKEGEILLDDMNVKDITLQSLRRNVGVVQQDVYLFAGTVIENIRYGKPDAGEAEVVAAAQKANAHDFIMTLPNGYHTDIGQRGVKLSGGQKQRLSIARVFLKDPPVLIFDEATSSLDNESERVVQESLEELAKHRTTFIIAHRLSTIRKSKRILVLTEQGIEEQGTHDELMVLNGVYARLFNLQFDVV
jgi:ATP-binding cassette subfamily B protein